MLRRSWSHGKQPSPKCKMGVTESHRIRVILWTSLDTEHHDPTLALILCVSERKRKRLRRFACCVQKMLKRFKPVACVMNTSVASCDLAKLEQHFLHDAATGHLWLRLVIVPILVRKLCMVRQVLFCWAALVAVRPNHDLSTQHCIGNERHSASLSAESVEGGLCFAC